MSSVFKVPVGDRTWRTRGGQAPPGAAQSARGSQQPTEEGREPGIVAGVLAPHPPHLLYGENPPQNEPRSEGGWETLRWAYESLRERIREMDIDVIVLHAPHWITMVGHHVNCVPNPNGFSVEPIFPHLLRYRYNFRTDVELAEAIADQAGNEGLVSRKMRNPGVRVDYATITALHLLNPKWDIPVVSLSANNNPYFYSTSSLEQMEVLGEATRKAIEGLGRRALVAGSNSLSHLHWEREQGLPEDMSFEHAYNHHQYQWDMRLLELIRAGRTHELREMIPEHIDQTESETKAGSLTWMLAALGWPEGLGEVLAYGTVIGTGNAVCLWDTRRRQ